MNNKYLIEDEMNIEENFTNYIVVDSEENKKYVLCILKNDFTYEKTREYLLSKFKTIKNLNFDYVINIIKIEIIYSINGIKLDKPQYGYLMEHFESKIDTQLYLKRCASHKKLDIFMEICAAINTLNMQGYLFDDITIKDIMLILTSKGNVKIKIKNLLQNELRKFNLLNSSVKSLPYQYNYETIEEANSNKNNVGQVINLIDQIFTSDELENQLKELDNIKNIYNQMNTINKSFKLKHFIKDINNKMQKNYKVFDSDALNKLQTNLDIIGMEEEIKIVEKNFQKILESKEKYKIIAFDGEDGSGKSRLLEEIKYRIENKYFQEAMYIGELSTYSTSQEEIYNDLINSIFEKADKSLVDKYGVYVKKFISLLISRDSLDSEYKQKLQLLNRLGKFINEYTMTKPVVLLIDNLDQRNEVFKSFIRYISFLGNNLENIMIVFTMDENKCDENFLEYIKNLNELEQYEEYKINYFNQYNTTRMVKNMLNTNEEINKFAIKIYSETLGNPQYISGAIKELYVNKTLYFNESTGEWKTKIKVKDILIPKALEKSLERNISSLNTKELRVLQKLSIFETPLSEKIILKYIVTELNQIEVFKKLKSKGFLADKISDQGILVGFTNNLLRNILYLKLHEKEKIEMHSEASIFMEELLYETDYYIEELLLHLERSGNYEKAYFYTVKYAKVQEIQGDFLKSISYYKEALKYPSGLVKSEIAIYIAKLYEKKSEHEKSYEFFEKANQIAINKDELDIEIYTLLEMIIIKINDITDMDEGIDYSLACVRRLLDKVNYIKGEIYYYYALALKARLECSHQLTLINAKKAKSICEENRIRDDVYGWILITLVGVYVKDGNYQESKELCIYASEIFSNNNNINGQLSSKLCYTSICKEEGEKNEVILKQYLEVVKLSNKHKIYKKEILTLIYIASIYRQERKYIYAEKYLLKALEKERDEGIDSYSINICNELCLLYIELGKINLAVKYYKLTKQMQKGLKLLEEHVINFGYTYASYNLLICNYDLAYEHLKDIYGLVFNTNNQYYKMITCNYYELMLYKCKNLADIKNVCDKLDEAIKILNDPAKELEIRISSIERILSLGYREAAKKLFFNLKGYPRDYNTEGIYICLELEFRPKNYYNFLINKALRVCAFTNSQEIKADLYAMVALKYSELGCKMLAFNYYYEAISIYMDTINLLPESDKISYVNNSKLLNTRELFIKCLKNDLNINIDFKEIHFVERSKKVSEILMELDLKNLLGNKSIFQLVQSFYERCYYNDLNDIYKVFERFSNDTIGNIQNVIKYIARLTLADKAMIVTENNEGETDVICTYRISDETEINRYFSLKVDSEEDIFVISNNDNRFYQLDNEALKDGIKSCMYMKIINKERKINSGKEINARLILITNNAVNNINNESKKIVEKFKPFLAFLLEKYNLTISSTLDKLTGVYNRKYFEEALLFLLDEALLGKNEFAVIMFDIDDFKGINDRYGHQTGDEVLIKLTQKVKESIGKSEVFGRYGGEEFIILCPSTNKEKAINLAEKIRINVEDAKILGDKRNVTISIGIALSAHESLSSEEIIERADQALYKAKNDGKNRYVLWENECGISSNTNNELTGILSGNVTKDYNLALILKEVANIVKYAGYRDEKIYSLILKIMQAIECETATAFIVSDKKIINIYSKSRIKDGWNIVEKFNFKLIYQVIEEGKGVYLIDWDSMENYNHYGIPDWKSICITPVLWNGRVLAVLYLSVSVNKKEFICNDYNLLNCFADISIPIFITNSDHFEE